VIRDFNGKSPTIAPSAFVSEAAYIVGEVEIGENSSVWPGAVIRADFGKIVVGKNSSIEDNCVIHGAADVDIGDNTIIGHGAVVHCCRVGDNVLVGNNATLLDGAQVGDSCIIGAGSVVSSGARIPNNSLVVGVPARAKGHLLPSQVAQLRSGPDIYVRLARKYRQEEL